MKASSVPTRSYRKGISDNKTPRPHVMKTRTSTPTCDKLRAESDQRSIKLSNLIATILDAHVAGTRPELPHAKGANGAALRELCRQGNNLNQIARQAHLMRLHLLEKKAIEVLGTINETARRLVA
jgi:hypothetical protein